MVPFAGYEMPVQYEGIIAEHLWTRENAGLFDVSHMGQLLVHGRGADVALEKMMPGDFQAAADMKPKYSLLLNDEGGILDDLMATRRGEDFYIVVNGATKQGDIADMERRLPRRRRHRSYEATGAARAPGPARRRGAGDHRPGCPASASCRVARSGGRVAAFGSAAPATPAKTASRSPCRQLPRPTWPTRSLAHDLVKPIGLGARDSLRLEAGLPLYGHDLDHRTTPVMAGLTFAINKRRRIDGGFAGAMRILAELENGPIEKRVGFDVEGRQPVREGALVLDGEGNEVGKITSGGFSPSLQRPIAMGYVAAPLCRQRHRSSSSSSAANCSTHGSRAMPFVPHRYHRKGASA